MKNTQNKHVSRAYLYLAWRPNWNWRTVRHIYVADSLSDIFYAGLRPGSELNY